MSKSQRVTANHFLAGTIWTVGHSTRSAEEFNQILKAHEIAELVDVRSFPGSRRYPQFNKEELGRSLSAANIVYKHMPSLGGRRRPNPESNNIAWKNASFRAYADHLESKEFKQGIKELLMIAQAKKTAVMCAEALWWRCHRSLISDYLKASDWEVIHIMDAQHREVHPYTSAARIVDGRLSYEGLF
jgi:uncharacterized protein (DUF488 family)